MDDSSGHAVDESASPHTDTMRFQNKVAIVTGGASGIGAAAVRLFAREGAHVAIGDLNSRAGNALADEIGPSAALYLACDVSRPTDIDTLVQTTASRFGAIDYLVNSAGIGPTPGTAPDITPEDWQRVVAVNLNSVFYACRAAIPHMRGRTTAIVNIASVSGLAGDNGLNAYNATKAAVINYSRTLAIDHAKDGIRVNCLCPGYIDTPLTAASNIRGLRDRWIEAIPMRRVGRAEEIADVIAFLLSEQSSYVTGAAIVADGGLMAWTGQPSLLEILHSR